MFANPRVGGGFFRYAPATSRCPIAGTLSASSGHDGFDCRPVSALGPTRPGSSTVADRPRAEIPEVASGRSAA